MSGTLLVVAFDSPVDEIHLDDELRKRPILCALTQMSVSYGSTPANVQWLMNIGIVLLVDEKSMRTR